MSLQDLMMKLVSLLGTFLCLTMLLPSPVHLQIFNRDVDTSSGRIRGTTTYHNGMPLRTYLGVPFAKPPLDELRFKKPEPVERSKTVIMANRQPPACIQYTIAPFPWRDDAPGQSEDCLYLNIWVPTSAGPYNKKSVMFWLYGGGYILGSNRKPIYDARALAADGDVIVVVINYRLGALGFLTSKSEEAPGNQGIYDMLEALKWTNENIEAFGGDRNKITIFGESSGAISVGLLCVSPLARGMFQRAVLESGSPAYLLGDNTTQNVDLSQKLAKAVGCANDEMTIQNSPDEVVSCLRTKDAMNLTRVLSSFNPLASRALFPIYGDSLLPRNPREAIIHGDFAKVDILAGNNRDEGSFQLTTSNTDVFGFFGEKDPQINKTYGAQLMRKLLQSFQERDEAVNYYLGDLDEDDYDEVRRQVYTASGDYVILCPTVYFAEKYAMNGNNVFFYFFTHRPSNSPWAPWMGVAHYEEVQFVFGSPLRSPTNYTLSEVRLSREMVRIWSSFAKTGQPSSTPSFPLYSRENPQYLSLNTSVIKKIGEGPHRDNCDFYRPYFGFE